jgi:hypothetical protein
LTWQLYAKVKRKEGRSRSNQKVEESCTHPIKTQINPDECTQKMLQKKEDRQDAMEDGYVIKHSVIEKHQKM